MKKTEKQRHVAKTNPTLSFRLQTKKEPNSGYKYFEQTAFSFSQHNRLILTGITFSYHSLVYICTCDKSIQNSIQ